MVKSPLRGLINSTPAGSSSDRLTIISLVSMSLTGAYG